MSGDTMIFPDNEPVVLDIAGNRAMVAGNKRSIEAILRDLGFSTEGAYLVRAISDDNDRKTLVKELIHLGALFSAGRDWSPAEVLALYREQGVVTEPYKVISWKNPGQYVIVTH